MHYLKGIQDKWKTVHFSSRTQVAPELHSYLYVYGYIQDLKSSILERHVYKKKARPSLNTVLALAPQAC